MVNKDGDHKLYKDKNNDIMEFDEKLHVSQLKDMQESVEQGHLVAPLIILGNLIQGKTVDTKQFFDNRKIPYVGKERRVKAGGFPKS